LQGNHLEAIENYEKALLAADDKDEVYYSIGLAYQSMDDYQQAIEAYKKSIEININHEGSLYELAFCLDVTGNLKAASNTIKSSSTKILTQQRAGTTLV
jgi:tetratricopeptide (TPR) repeat protein